MAFSQATLDLQKELLAEGYDPGPLDGLMGPKTRAAIDAREAAVAATDAPAEVDEESPQGELAQGTPQGVLQGGQVFVVGARQGGLDPLYFQAYRIPGTTDWALFQYDSKDQITDILGTNYSTTYFSEGTFFGATESGQFAVKGNASEMAGVPGDFAGLYARTTNEALVAGGVTDPSLRGRLLQDPEVQQIMANANLGEFSEATMSDDAIKAELRNTNIWKNEIYAGIQFFYDRGDAEPEAAWRQYQNNVSEGLRTLGFQPDADGSFTQTIGGMLGDGIADTEFVNSVDIFQTVQNNPGLKAQMDEWALITVGRPLDFNEYLDVLEGTNDAELDVVVESATLAFAAEKAGVAVAIADIQSLAQQTDLSDAQALAAFTQAEKDILAIGNQDLAVFGVTQGDFLDVAAGAKPRSGRSAAEVQNLAAKLASERGLSDDPSARFFLGFGQRGQPQRTGTQSLAAVGG